MGRDCSPASTALLPCDSIWLTAILDHAEHPFLANVKAYNKMPSAQKEKQHPMPTGGHGKFGEPCLQEGAGHAVVGDGAGGQASEGRALT